MTDALAHRGPDGEGQWCQGQIGLGHRRLAIIDLSPDASQPMHSHDGRFVITYNGEVYNFRELRRELEKAGSRFISTSDTEVVLEAVVRWGIDTAIRRFNGMFAFAIFDRQDQQILLGRDRYGIKPLYTWSTRDALAFASEPKAFRVLPRFHPSLDPAGVAEYLTFQNILTNRTFLKDVAVFPPGHWAQASAADGSLRMHSYWDFSFHESNSRRSDREYSEELRRLLTQAVSRQLVSDVEVGAYLSGGLDSGSIVAMASEQVPRMKTFTVGFELDSVAPSERTYDERAAAETVAAATGTTQIELVLGARHISACLPALSYHMDEPRVGQSYPNFYAASLASRFVKVVLAGTGGDEILGGYPWRYPPKHLSHVNFTEWHFQQWRRLLTEAQLQRFLSPLVGQLSRFDAREIHRGLLSPAEPTASAYGDNLSVALYFEAKTFLPGLLAVEDRLSMAHGLEVRVPFLDNDLVDFCQGLPRSVRLSEGISGGNTAGVAGRSTQGKGILRDAMRGYLPNDVLDSHKQGFSGPDSRWFSGELRASILEHVRKMDTSVGDAAFAEDLLNDAWESEAGGRLLSWSLLSTSLHLQDWFPAGVSQHDG